MRGRIQLAVFFALTLVVPLAIADAPETFAPFEQWKTAVLAGDAAALKTLYRADPPVQVRINTLTRDADADINFWLELRPRSMSVEIIRNEPRHGHISFIFRSEVVSGAPGGQTVSLTDDQTWQQIGGQWRLIAVERTDAPRLKQPANMKKDLYPANADAHAEIKE